MYEIQWIKMRGETLKFLLSICGFLRTDCRTVLTGIMKWRSPVYRATIFWHLESKERRGEARVLSQLALHSHSSFSLRFEYLESVTCLSKVKFVPAGPSGRGSRTRVCGRFPAEIVGSNPTGRGLGCLSVVSVVYCQVEVSAASWSMVQRSPTDCGASLCVI